jgi:hypothetical protein
VVIEQPSGGLGAINDMWFQWVIDVGKPGPDRGLGGKYGLRSRSSKALGHWCPLIAACSV